MVHDHQVAKHFQELVIKQPFAFGQHPDSDYRTPLRTVLFDLVSNHGCRDAMIERFGDRPVW